LAYLVFKSLLILYNRQMLKQFIQKYNLTPRKLLLIDGIGALVSALLLGVLLVRYHLHIGLPVSTLYLLAGIALLIAFFSLSNYFFNTKATGLVIAYIGFLNIGYCIFTLIVINQPMGRLSIVGWIYFLIEISIIIMLAILEIKAAKRYNNRIK
jgi:hypothetical protein